VENDGHRVAVVEDLELLLAEAVGGHFRRRVAPVVHQVGQVAPDGGVLHQIARQRHLDVAGRLTLRLHRRAAELPVPHTAQLTTEVRR
jgi:hypothetical protein